MNVITHTFVRLKCLTETKIQSLYDHVDHTRFHSVEMGCQMVQLLAATMFVNLTQPNNTLSANPTLLTSDSVGIIIKTEVNSTDRTCKNRAL